MGKNVTLLLGAGASKAATYGLPESMLSADELTNNILYDSDLQNNKEVDPGSLLSDSFL